MRWQTLQNVHDRFCSNPTLKALNPTRWSGRYDAVYALKERFCDVMKYLTHIIQGAPKRPDTFENLIEIKRVDENN